jgi:hypothetical protein
MSGTADSWPALSFLEGLRPATDENVKLALLASYSADLGSIGATLLALAGKDTDAGRGSPSDFADAVDLLRGKVRIVIQRGRLATMRRTPRIAAVLDQFVREVDFDEATHSWHPKAALIQTLSMNGEIGWRLWIGSRNLTENVNRDIGLLLVSDAKRGAPIAGADELARALAERAALKTPSAASLAKMISKVAWRPPSGVEVERILWLSGSGGHPVPVPLTGTDEVVIVSPFVDAGFLARQMPKGEKPARCILLTTMREIERIGTTLPAFNVLLALDAPDYPVGDPEPEPQPSTSGANVGSDGDEEEEIGHGLHAKLLFMRVGHKRTLWLGSANATMRAWSGRNAEVTAELLVTKQIEKGLKALLNTARMVEAPSIDHLPDPTALEEEALEHARVQVAARWAAVLSIDEKGVRLTHRSDLYPGGPHPDESDIVLSVGALNGEPAVFWPAQQAVVHLGPVASAERSELVRLRVSRGDRGVSWLQRALADPPMGADRDRAAFVRFLGTRGFLLWLAGVLANDDRQAEGDWMDDELPARAARGRNAKLDSSLPTLEEMLSAWARDPEKFREIERRVSQYLPALLHQAELEEPQNVAILKRFDVLWGKLRSGLGVAEFKRKRR